MQQNNEVQSFGELGQETELDPDVLSVAVSHSLSRSAMIMTFYDDHH